MGLFSFISAKTFGQLSINTPYSRFGIGSLYSPGFVKNFSLGGISAPLIDGSATNFGNPASYSYLSQPVFQVSLGGASTTISDSNSSNRFRGGTVNEIGFGFKKEGGKWAFAMGLTPYSATGYKLENVQTINDSLKVKYIYQGEGGINKFLAGVSRSFLIPVDTTKENSHRLNIGANFNYYFGAINQFRRAVYNNTTYNNTRVNSKTSVNDVNLDLGLLYFMPLRLVKEGGKTIRGKYLTIGVDYSLKTNLNARFNETGITYYNFSGVEIPLDTAFTTPETRGSLTLPERLSVGFSYLYLGKRGSSVVLSGEYTSQDWKKFSAQFGDIAQNAELTSYKNYAGGIEYTPTDPYKAKGFFGTVQYRLGLRYTETYLSLKNNQITQQAVSGGISFPFLASRSRYSNNSKIFIGAEYGTGGTTQNGLLKENFLNIRFGFTFIPFERWFEPTKYD